MKSNVEKSLKTFKSRSVLTYSTQIGADPRVAAEYLLRGELTAIPTETVYGLAGNALDPVAVSSIFAVKNRPAFDPLIVHLPGMEAVTQYALDFPEPARILAEAFWPGPLTLLLPRRERIPDLTTSGLPRVALRVPAHPLTLQLLKSLPFPLAAPSANPFGYISPTTAQHVYDQLAGRLPYILDGGPCRVGLESTIVGFEDDRIFIHRLGGLSREEIESLVGPVELKVQQGDNPSAPGMLTSHYAPGKPTFLGSIDELMEKFQGKKIGVLTWTERKDYPQAAFQTALSASGDDREAARRLFAALRTLDAANIDVILAEPAPEEGLGRAINDRLRRAAAENS